MVNNVFVVRKEVIDKLYETFPNERKVVTEYVKEAEHQQGFEYWSNFSMQELVEDCELYIEMAKGE